MTEFDRIQIELAELRRLARVQKLARLGIRMLWLFGGGTILGWGINQFWGLLPSSSVWLLAGLVLASFPLLQFILTAKNQSDWTWMLDRRLGLREQVSTALEIAQTRDASPVSEALVQDVLIMLPQIRARMLEKGWYLRRDLVSLLIVGLLGVTLLAANLLGSYSKRLAPPELAGFLIPTPIQPLDPQHLPNSAPEPTPTQDSSANGEENQGGGGPSPNNAQGDSGGDQGGAENTPSGPISEVLLELGADLSQQAGTYGVGKALENLDLDRAADELQELAERLDELSQESRANMSKSLEEAAEEAAQAGAPGLSAAMENAAKSLQSQSRDAERSLGGLANELRALEESLNSPELAEADTTPSTTGKSEPLSRLEGEGGEFELSSSNGSDSALLNPSASGVAGAETLSDPFNSAFLPDNGMNQSPLLPNVLYWKWRNVVSRYFQR